MRPLARALVLALVGCSTKFALSQTGACANPNAPRIGLLIQDKFAETVPASPRELVALSKRRVDADSRFRDQIAKRLPASACIVMSRDIFDDAKNFPQLKGSTIFEISADPSPKNAGVFALSVTVSAAQGIYAQDELRLFTIPVLIETESDYAQGAEAVMKYWQFFGEAWDRDHGK